MTLASAVWSWKDKEVSLSCGLVELLFKGKGDFNLPGISVFSKEDRKRNKQSITICSRFENLTRSLGLPIQPIFAPYFLKEHAPSLLFPKKSAHKTQICMSKSIFQK